VGKCIIAVEDILDAAKSGRKSLTAPAAECIVTPGARDKAAELGITIADGSDGTPAHSSPVPAPPAATTPPESMVHEVCRLLQQRLPAGTSAKELETLVRSAVAARLSGNNRPATADAGTAPAAHADGVCFVNGARLLDGGASGSPAPVAGAAIVADALRCGMDAKLAAGFMEWEKAAFNRTVEFPEVAVVLEGELRLTVGGRTLTAKPGDMVYLRKGIQVAYAASGRVRIACINCTKD
jgi:ethanolamine utilization protein EutQ